MSTPAAGPGDRPWDTCTLVLLPMSDLLPIHFLDGPHGTRVAYAVHGSGPLLVCPPWWISHLEADWGHPPLRRFFERLGRTHTVLRYDRPGAGLSVGGEEAASLATEIAVLEAVLDHVEADRAAIFAVSCAGPPALCFAAAQPRRVARLALYGSYVTGSDVGPPEVFDAFCSLVDAHWGLGSEALANLLNPGLAGGELRALGRRQRTAADAGTACRQLRMTYALDASERVSAVSCPTLVIHRKGDRTIPLAAGRKLAAALPGCSLVTLDGAAHLPWDGEEDVVAVLEAFLTSTPLAAAVEAAEPSGAGVRHDRDNRQLRVDGERRPLTPLEHGLLCYLVDHEDSVVSRDEALRDVWQQPFAGSNVVDAVVLSLRRKLQPYAAAIETVTGHGYRLKSGTVGR